MTLEWRADQEWILSGLIFSIVEFLLLYFKECLEVVFNKVHLFSNSDKFMMTNHLGLVSRHTFRTKLCGLFFLMVCRFLDGVHLNVTYTLSKKKSTQVELWELNEPMIVLMIRTNNRSCDYITMPHQYRTISVQMSDRVDGMYTLVVSCQ